MVKPLALNLTALGQRPGREEIPKEERRRISGRSRTAGRGTDGRIRGKTGHRLRLNDFSKKKHSGNLRVTGVQS